MTEPRPIEMPERLRPELHRWFRSAVEHVRRAAGEHVERFRCPHCPADFVAPESLRSHLASQHPTGR